MDDDLVTLDRDALVAEVKRLRAGIREHRDSFGHGLCWHHPKLWGLLPEKTDPEPSYLLMPTWFTEMWVPFTPGDGRVAETIARLRQCFDADGTAEGAYAATGSHAFRVDVFWFANNAVNPVTSFFPRFWNALEPLGYRLHWGKFLPPPDATRPDRITSRYPHWERWQAVRARVDPGGVFLTRYWREHLGSPEPNAPAAWRYFEILTKIRAELKR